MNQDRFKLPINMALVNNLIKAQEEVERLNLKNISPIIFFKILVESEESKMAEFLDLAGVKWKKIEESLTKQVDDYVKENIGKEENEILFPISMKGQEKIQLCLTNEMYNIMCSAINFSTYNIVDEITITLAMFSTDIPKGILKFFRSIKIDVLCVSRYYTGLLTEQFIDDYYDEEPDKPTAPKENAQSNERIQIPDELANCLNVVVPETSKESSILCRDEETEKLMTVLLKNKKKNAILIGKPGVGKTAIVEHLAWKIAKGECAKELKNKVIISLDTNSIIAGTIYRGQAEERFEFLVEFLKATPNIILFVDEIHTVIGAGQCTENKGTDLANVLKPVLSRGDISVIGATTDDEYQKCLLTDKAFNRRFEKIRVSEPSYDEVYPMIKKQIKRLKEAHNVKIDNNVINDVIMMASCFNASTCNPDRTIDLLDMSMAKAKMKGDTYVTKKTVLSNFDANIQRFKQMSIESKTEIAYHETGHYLYIKYGEYLKDYYKVLAVTIIPTDDYCGLTVKNRASKDIKQWNYNECLDEIACDVAGRVAQKIYSNCYSAGAIDDLKCATEEAKNMIVKYGLISDFSLRNFEEDIDEKKKQELNKLIDQLISKAYARAEKLINEHNPILVRIANELVKNGILTGEELDKICKEEEKKKELVVIKS